MTERELTDEHVIEPGTGKALELRRGQVLRIEQLVGEQCADFNCFNLHDYKEFFHTGRTRHMHGLNPSTGDFLWSAPPRERPMAAIVADTTGSNDILYSRCSAFLFEYQYGLDVHTNCHDIQSEAQREYGLTPDDVHDSFNFFMNTGIDASGRPFIAGNMARRGDYVEILALIDLLAVPSVCGADVMATSSFELKPLRLGIYNSLAGEIERIEARPELQRRRSQRTPDDFKIKQIRVERELSRDPAYQPEFMNVPLVVEDVPVELDEADAAQLDALVASGDAGATDAEALRHAFFSWWIKNYMNGPKHYDEQIAAPA
jgi:uncharacterized protein